MTTLLRRSQHGFTLVEAMVVIVLAGVVTIGLLGFYLNSQATWMDGSSQVMAQRDATLVLEGIAEHARVAYKFDRGDGSEIIFLDSSLGELSRFSWHNAANDDSLMYHSEFGGPEKAVISSIVESFQVTADIVPSVVHISLRLRSTDGARISTSSAFGLNNATPTP